MWLWLWLKKLTRALLPLSCLPNITILQVICIFWNLFWSITVSRSLWKHSINVWCIPQVAVVHFTWPSIFYLSKYLASAVFVNKFEIRYLNVFILCIVIPPLTPRISGENVVFLLHSICLTAIATSYCRIKIINACLSSENQESPN